ncbi:hypothetical protein [Aeromonas hydrophila]|uniref:hypothetical protein n=1 Tax=Aeromonas hydrophila TaxID=644 RepID=UPI0029297B12|nr:hypothetical protein [Aeromonas hydrophila]
MALTMAEIRARLQAADGLNTGSKQQEQEQPNPMLPLYEYLKHCTDKTRNIISPELRMVNGERYGCSYGIATTNINDRMPLDQDDDIWDDGMFTPKYINKYPNSMYEHILRYTSCYSSIGEFTACNPYFVRTGYNEDSIEAATVFRVDYKEWSFDVFVFYSRVQDETYGDVEGYVVCTVQDGPIASELASVIPFTDAWEFDMRMHGAPYM